MREILAIELATLAQIDDQTRDATLRASIECADGNIVLQVERLDTHEVLEEQIEIAAQPTARAIALVLTELVAATRPIGEGDPDALPPPPDEPIDEPAQAVSFVLDGTFVLRVGAGRGPHMGGLRAGLSYFLLPFLRLSTGVEWLMGARGTQLGRVRASSLGADVALGIGYTRGAAWLGIDGGLRMGAMVWSGSDDGATVDAARSAKASVGLFGRALYEHSVSDRVSLRASFEIGAFLVGSRANAVDDSGGMPVVIDSVRADAFWCAFALGAAYAL